MSDIIKASDIFDSDIFTKTTEDALKFRDAIVANVEALKELAKFYQQSLAKVKFVDSKDIKDANKLMKEAAVLITTLERLNKQLAAAQAKLTGEMKLTTEQQAKQRVEAAKLNKDLKDQVTATTANVGAYQKLSAQYRIAAEEAKNLAVEFGANSEQARKAAAGANELRAKLEAAEQSVGQFNRNVGNYSGGILDAWKKTGLFTVAIEVLEKITRTYDGVLELLNLKRQKEIALDTEATAKELVHTEAVEAGAAATEIQTASKEANLAVTGEEIAADQAHVAAESADTAATEANTAANKANTLSRLGVIGAVVAAAAVIYELVKAFTKTQAAQDELAADEAYLKVLKETGGQATHAAEAMRNYVKAMQQLEEMEIQNLPKIAKLQAEAKEAREKAAETDVIPDKISALKEHNDKLDEAFEIEIEHLRAVAEEKKKLADADDKDNIASREARKEAAEAEKAVFDAEKEHAMAKMKTSKQIMQNELEMRKEEVSMANEMAKNNISLIKVERDQKLAASRESFEEQYKELVEQQRKLGDADGTDPKHATERLALKRAQYKAEADIKREADEAQIKALQSFSDTVRSIYEKVSSEEIEMIKIADDKKKAQINQEYEREMVQIQNQERANAETRRNFYKLNAKDRAEQEAKLKDIETALAAEKIEAEKRKTNAIIQVDADALKRIRDIENQMANEGLQQTLKRTEQLEALAEKKTNKDASGGGASASTLKNDINQQEVLFEQETVNKKTIIRQQYFQDEQKINEDLTISEEEKNEKILALNQKLQDDLENLDNAELNKKEEFERKKSEIVKKELKEQADAVINFTQEALQRKNALEEAQLNNDLDMRQRNILQQQQLAEAGYANDLAFEKAAAAKDELRKQQLAKKEQQQAKALAFLKLFASYAEKENPDQALAKTLVQMAIAGAIAGSYKDGIEGIDGPGTETSDSIFARLSKNESVVTAAGTKSNPGLPTAMNEGRVDEYFERNYLPKYLGMQPGSFGQNVSNSILIHQVATMNEKLSKIEKALSNQPRVEYHVDEALNAVKKITQNGLTRMVKANRNGSRNNLI